MGHELTENGRRPKKNNVIDSRHSARRRAKKAGSTAELRSIEKRSGIGGPRSWNRSQTDKYGGWLGFLRKHVGEPWDKVYSQLVARLKGEGEMHRWHALEGHLRWEVDLHVEMEGEVAYRKASSWRGYRSRVRGFYVHPDTGLLCYQEPERYRRPRQEKEELIEGDLMYQLRDGTWYVYGDGGASLKVGEYYHNGEWHDNPYPTVRPLSNKELEIFYEKHPKARRV